MRPRLVGIAAILAQTALTLLIAAATYFSLIPAVFGSGGLNLANGMLPSFKQKLMNFEVDPTPQMIDRVVQAPEADLFAWKQTSNGTVDAATGLPPVEASWMGGWSVTFLNPSWTDRFWYAMPAVASTVLLICVLLLMFKMIGTARVDRFATEPNARRLLAIAVIIGVGGSVCQVAEIVGRHVILGRSAAAGLFEIEWFFSFTPLMAGFVLVLLANLMRRNVALRQDLAGLV